MESVIKQRDFFETEYRKVLNELHKRGHVSTASIETDNVITELKKEIGTIKYHNAGEINRLN